VSKGWQVARIDEVELPQLVNTARWAGLRRHFGIESFGVNAWSADEGQDVIGEHDESQQGHEELYVVLSGRAAFTVDGENVDGTPGTVVFVRDPAAKRKAVAQEADTRVLALGAKRGEVFTPSAWERSAPAFPYFAAGDYEGARKVLEEAHATWPDDATILYNLACAESGCGRKAEAIEYLRRAVEGGERYRELARTDTDFDPIRDEPEFQRLLA
jgi:tetratricopeptide (TPR) repeat protein